MCVYAAVLRLAPLTFDVRAGRILRTCARTHARRSNAWEWETNRVKRWEDGERAYVALVRGSESLFPILCSPHSWFRSRMCRVRCGSRSFTVYVPRDFRLVPRVCVSRYVSGYPLCFAGNALTAVLEQPARCIGCVAIQVALRRPSRSRLDCRRSCDSRLPSTCARVASPSRIARIKTIVGQALPSDMSIDSIQGYERK